MQEGGGGQLAGQHYVAEPLREVRAQGVEVVRVRAEASWHARFGWCGIDAAGMSESWNVVRCDEQARVLSGEGWAWGEDRASGDEKQRESGCADGETVVHASPPRVRLL